MLSVLFLALTSSGFVVTPVTCQISFGALGGGLLNSAYLQTGGLIYPNADGSGPQADSLAAAIYGVAIPPGFNQFSASENFFGRGNDVFPGNFDIGRRIDGVKPADLLIGTGIHINSNRLNNQGDLDKSYSSYISDFSVFNGGLHSPPSSDQGTSSSSFVEIDPVAARFGVVIPGLNHQSTLFHPSLSGSTETFSSINAGSTDGLKEIVISSPVETSILFNLPTQVTLPHHNGRQPNFQLKHQTGENSKLSSEFGQEKVDSPTKDPNTSANTDQRLVTASEKNPFDAIKTVFRFSDEQISKTEEIYRNFEQTSPENLASGKFTSSSSSSDVETATKPETEEEFRPVTVKHNQSENSHIPASPPRSNEAKAFSNDGTKSNSPSPYVYRGGYRDREQAQQSTPTTTVSETPEILPAAEYLLAPPNSDGANSGDQKAPNEYRNLYSFLTPPGYHNNQ